MIGILVVVENLLDVDASLTTRGERVRHRLGAELAIHANFPNRIVGGRARLEPGERIDEGSSGRADLHHPPPQVCSNLSNLHIRAGEDDPLSRTETRSRLVGSCSSAIVLPPTVTLRQCPINDTVQPRFGYLSPRGDLRPGHSRPHRGVRVPGRADPPPR